MTLATLASLRPLDLFDYCCKNNINEEDIDTQGLSSKSSHQMDFIPDAVEWLSVTRNAHQKMAGRECENSHLAGSLIVVAYKKVIGNICKKCAA
jgi:hypothetical protein